jgi:hypothetical protein
LGGRFDHPATLNVTNQGTVQASNAPAISAQAAIRLVAGATLPALTG